MRLMAMAAVAALAVTGLVMICSGSRSPAVAADPPKCNTLPTPQCIACAKRRGFKPEQYRPYCGA